MITPERLSVSTKSLKRELFMKLGGIMISLLLGFVGFSLIATGFLLKDGGGNPAQPTT